MKTTVETCEVNKKRVQAFLSPKTDLIIMFLRMNHALLLVRTNNVHAHVRMLNIVNGAIMRFSQVVDVTLMH